MSQKTHGQRARALASGPPPRTCSSGTGCMITGDLPTGTVSSPCCSPRKPFLPPAGKLIRRCTGTWSECRVVAGCQPVTGEAPHLGGGNGVRPTCVPENCSARY